MDGHLVRIPGLASVSVGGLAGGNAEVLGGHAHGALDLELLVLGPLDKVAAHLC